jgi:hypothetical protein
MSPKGGKTREWGGERAGRDGKKAWRERAGRGKKNAVPAHIFDRLITRLGPGNTAIVRPVACDNMYNSSWKNRVICIFLSAPGPTKTLLCLLSKSDLTDTFGSELRSSSSKEMFEESHVTLALEGYRLGHQRHRRYCHGSWRCEAQDYQNDVHNEHSRRSLCRKNIYSFKIGTP